MHARWLVTLISVLAALTPAAAAEHVPAYTVAELRGIARSIHPTLEAAEAAVEASAGLLKQAGAYPNPEIAFGVGRGRPLNGGDYRSENQVLLVQPIEMPGIRKWRSRLAEARLRGVQVDRVLAKTVVDATVAALAYTVLLEQRRTEIARDSAGIASRLHELLAHRVELGESSPLEAVRARAEWFARRRDLIDAESTLVAARSALDLFCAGRLPEDFTVAETLEDQNTAALPVDLVERLRIGNPLLIRAGIAVEEAAMQIEVTRKEVFPRIELFAGHETELDRIGSAIGVGLTIPLWNRNKGALAAATGEQSAASANMHVLVLELETSLAQASAAYERALAAVRLHLEGWTVAAGDALGIATFSFENGEASLLEVLDAQRSYLSVRLSEAESWARIALARADIERLIAGPLNPEDSDVAQ